jgi:uncharacterized protein
MTNEERDIIANFMARVGGAAASQPGPWGGASVPATQAQALPPIDPEADRFIAEQFNRYPEARYRITQLAFVQDHALAEAQNRLKQLEWELQQAQQRAAQQPQQQSGGGFFSGLFGGGRQQGAPPPGGQPGGPWGQGAPPPQYQQAAPPPQYAPATQPGMFQRSGSGFLGSALTTAAGVAGGVLAADAIRDLFSPRQTLGGGFAPDAPLGGGGMPSADPGYVDQGSWTSPDPGAGQPDPGYVDSGTWDQGGTDPSATPDPTNDPSGGGWDQGSSDSGWDQGGTSDDDSLI